MKYDVTKVTHNKYSCDTCCMSRDMMEMDGRDSANFGISEFVNDNRTKT